MEENIEKAMSFVLHSTHLNAFAGIFYYLKDLKKAKFHPGKVFRHRVHHPDAYSYAGLIALTEKKPAYSTRVYPIFMKKTRPVRVRSIPFMPKWMPGEKTKSGQIYN